MNFKEIRVLNGSVIIPDGVSGKYGTYVVKYAEPVSFKTFVQMIYDDETIEENPRITPCTDEE